MKTFFSFYRNFDTKRLLWLVTILILFLAFSFFFRLPFTWSVLGIIVLCFFCELMDSSLGMGYGTTLTPVLLAMGYEPLELVPTILLSEFLSGFASSYFHHDLGNVNFSRTSPDLKIAMLLALGSIVGVSIGVNLAVQIPVYYLKLLIGIIILLAGLIIWFMINRSFVFRTWKMMLLAGVASFNKALSGGGYGPLLTSGQILSGISGRASVGITSFAEGFTCLIGVILFLGKGQEFTVQLMVPVLTGALLSVPLSAEFVKRFSENTLKRSIAILTILLGGLTIIKVLF